MPFPSPLLLLLLPSPLLLPPLNLVAPPLLQLLTSMICQICSAACKFPSFALATNALLYASVSGGVPVARGNACKSA